MEIERMASEGEMQRENLAPSAPTSTPTGKYTGGTLIPHRIFVGGIPPQTTEHELRSYFESFGAVKDVKIIKDHAGVPKGYGFVTYETEEDAKRVQQFQTGEVLEFKGRRLNIGPAIRKVQPQRQSDVSPMTQGTVLYQQNGLPLTFHNGIAYMATPETYSLAQPHGGIAYHPIVYPHPVFYTPQTVPASNPYTPPPSGGSVNGQSPQSQVCDWQTPSRPMGQATPQSPDKTPNNNGGMSMVNQGGASTPAGLGYRTLNHTVHIAAGPMTQYLYPPPASPYSYLTPEMVQYASMQPNPGTAAAAPAYYQSGDLGGMSELLAALETSEQQNRVGGYRQQKSPRKSTTPMTMGGAQPQGYFTTPQQAMTSPRVSALTRAKFVANKATPQARSGVLQIALGGPATTAELLEAATVSSTTVGPCGEAQAPPSHVVTPPPTPIDYQKV